jgi:hypothetical protein
VAKIAATNAVGEGAYSVANTAGVGIRTEPGAPPNSPQVTYQGETMVTISIEHLTGLDAGNADVLYYALSWDEGLAQAQWEVYTVVSSSTASISIPGLTSGATYAFKYRAQNVHGWSADYSPVLTVAAMRVPGQVGSVATAMNGALV